MAAPMKRQAKLAQHIATLCHVRKITRKTSSSRGRAWRDTRTIAIPPVRSAITYAVALHEIGHVLGKSGRTRLDREVYAWQWAEQHAMVWTDSMDHKRSRCLATYVAWAKRRQKADTRKRTFITADHAIWRYINPVVALMAGCTGFT